MLSAMRHLKSVLKLGPFRTTWNFSCKEAAHSTIHFKRSLKEASINISHAVWDTGIKWVSLFFFSPSSLPLSLSFSFCLVFFFFLSPLYQWYSFLHLFHLIFSSFSFFLFPLPCFLFHLVFSFSFFLLSPPSYLLFLSSFSSCLFFFFLNHIFPLLSSSSLSLSFPIILFLLSSFLFSLFLFSIFSTLFSFVPFSLNFIRCHVFFTSYVWSWCNYTKHWYSGFFHCLNKNFKMININQHQ